jgi:hypothetical protein
MLRSLSINFALHFVESEEKIGFERLNIVDALRTKKEPIN